MLMCHVRLILVSQVLGVFVGYLYYIGMASMLGYFSPLCAESMTVDEGYVSKSPFKSAS